MEKKFSVASPRARGLRRRQPQPFTVPETDAQGSEATSAPSPVHAIPERTGNGISCQTLRRGVPLPAPGSDPTMSCLRRAFFAAVLSLFAFVGWQVFVDPELSFHENLWAFIHFVDDFATTPCYYAFNRSAMAIVRKRANRVMATALMKEMQPVAFKHSWRLKPRSLDERFFIPASPSDYSLASVVAHSLPLSRASVASPGIPVSIYEHPDLLLPPVDPASFIYPARTRELTTRGSAGEAPERSGGAVESIRSFVGRVRDRVSGYFASTGGGDKEGGTPPHSQSLSHAARDSSGNADGSSSTDPRGIHTAQMYRQAKQGAAEIPVSHTHESRQYWRLLPPLPPSSAERGAEEAGALRGTTPVSLEEELKSRAREETQRMQGSLVLPTVNITAYFPAPRADATELEREEHFAEALELLRLFTFRPVASAAAPITRQASRARRDAGEERYRAHQIGERQAQGEGSPGRRAASVGGGEAPQRGDMKRAQDAAVEDPSSHPPEETLLAQLRAGAETVRTPQDARIAALEDVIQSPEEKVDPGQKRTWKEKVRSVISGEKAPGADGLLSEVVEKHTEFVAAELLNSAGAVHARERRRATGEPSGAEGDTETADVSCRRLEGLWAPLCRTRNRTQGGMAASEKRRPALFFIHGGGLVMNDHRGYDKLLRRLSNLLAPSGALVFAIDYRLAPEHKFPLALQDCLQAISFVAGNAEMFNVDLTRLAVLGDSGGGSLAAAAVGEALRRADEFPWISHVRALALVYPSLCRGCATRSQIVEGSLFYLKRDVWFSMLYSEEIGAPDDWRQRPFSTPADLLRRFPPTFLVLFTHDIMYDIGVLFHEKLRRQGVKTGLYVAPGFHGFFGSDRWSRFGVPSVEWTAERIMKSW